MGQLQVGFKRLLGAFDRLRSLDPAASDGNRQHCEREPARGNTRRHEIIALIVVRTVFHKPRFRVRLAPEIVKRTTG